MKTRQTLLLGLAGLGFVLAMPVHAGLTTPVESPASMAQGFVIAARDNAEAKQERRDFRGYKEDERGRGNKSQSVRDVERSADPQDYGYGYERRQQPHSPRNEGRHRH